MDGYQWDKGEFNPSCVCGGSVDKPNCECERCAMQAFIKQQRELIRKLCRDTLIAAAKSKL